MENNCIRIGMKAPDFSAATTFGPIKLSDYQGKWVVLFSPRRLYAGLHHRVSCLFQGAAPI